jgi:hypothetical protein
MIWGKNRKTTLSFLAVGLFVVTGTYNTIVINSESHLASSDVKFVKRLDELYGVTVPGREVAASISWQKLTPTQISQIKVKKRFIEQAVKTADAAPSTQQEVIAAAAVQEELSLNLVEVINPKLFAQGIPQGQFNGSLSTNNGVIESLSVSLPNTESVSVSFSEMAGNVFEYDYGGELYSGMMYQVDQGSYMVTLTNGPLEGTRLRFQSDAPAVDPQQVQQALANNNIEPGNFGQDQQQDQVALQDPNQEQPQVQAQEYVPRPYNPEQFTPEQLSQNDQMMAEQGTQAQLSGQEPQQAM